MHENVYSAPQSDLNTSKVTDAEVWNPDVAGAWSLLFTPLFGSILVYKNWQSLGELERAQQSKKWIYISVLMALLSAVLGLVGLIYIITWYFASQKPQSVFLKTEHGGVYRKKSWGKPLLIALGLWFALVVIIFTVVGLMFAL